MSLKHTQFVLEAHGGPLKPVRVESTVPAPPVRSRCRGRTGWAGELRSPSRCTRALCWSR